MCRMVHWCKLRFPSIGVKFGLKDFQWFRSRSTLVERNAHGVLIASPALRSPAQTAQPSQPIRQLRSLPEVSISCYQNLVLKHLPTTLQFSYSKTLNLDTFLPDLDQAISEPPRSDHIRLSKHHHRWSILAPSGLAQIKMCHLATLGDQARGG